MNVNELIKQAKDYIGFVEEPNSPLVECIMAVANRCSKEVFLNEEALKKALLEEGASELQAAKVVVLTKVNGFRELLEADERTQQNDIDRFVQNAIMETGYTRGAVLEMTAALLAGSRIVMEVTALGDITDNGQNAFVIPYSLYEDELEDIADDLKHGAGSNELDTDTVEKLYTLSQAGIPKAKELLGDFLIRNEELYHNSAWGMELLQDAAEAGDFEAVALLGDYYYDSGDSDGFQKAFECYTGYGALALNGIRRSRIAGMIAQKKTNRKRLAECVLLSLFMLILLILQPGKEVYRPVLFIGIFCFVIQTGLLVLAFIHNKLKPYESINWVPAAMWGAMALYIACRFIF